MKDTRTILLGMLSVGLVGTWVYHLYDKTQYASQRNEIFIKDSVAVAQAIQDSLHRIYAATINSLDARLDSTRNNAGILEGALQNKLQEINKLRSEIGAILKKNDVKREDLDIARKKSLELQRLVAELQSRNNSIEEEKRQISAVLEKVNGQVKDLEGNVTRLDQENKALTEKVNLASSFIASELKLSTVTVKSNERETETSTAKKANKLVISFAVQNNVSDYEVADVYVQIMQPNGKPLENEDAWETYTTTLQNGSKVNYSRKVRFEYEKGETKRLIFSLSPEECMKGTYTMRIFHNGYKIGETTKTLN